LYVESSSRRGARRFQQFEDFGVYRGSGETGAVSVTHTSYDHNKLILVALEGERMDLLVKGVKQLLDRLVEERFGDPVPLKAFVQACEPVLL
jgi:hypothetical protein